MSIRDYNISGIDIFVADYEDISHATFSDAQLSDIAGMASDKRRRERQLTYLLINQAAVTPRFSRLSGCTLGHNEDGSPYLKNPSGLISDIAISVSHCRSGACIALGDSGMGFGIDIEDENDKLVRVSPKFINDSESLFISAEMLLAAWTIKEAVYKAVATPGLSLTAGIDIKSIAEDDTASPEFRLSSSIAAAGNIYRGYSRMERHRCITLCLRL